MRVRQALFGATISAIWLAATAATGWAQSADENAAEPINWLVNCTNTGAEGALQCQMTQSVVLRETGQRLLTISIRKDPNAEAPAMMLTLPHGLFLPAGVKMIIDASEQDTLPVQTCEAAGCYAGLAIPQTVLDEMRYGSDLEFVVQDLQKREVRLKSTLKGFTSAYDKIAAE